MSPLPGSQMKTCFANVRVPEERQRDLRASATGEEVATRDLITALEMCPGPGQ